MPLKVPKQFFVTGTDTGAGKTKATQVIMQALQQQGYSAVGCKPIACGMDQDGNHEDVLGYQAINSVTMPQELINPVKLKLPASPNIAAVAEDIYIDTQQLIAKLAPLSQLPADFIFYEGLGGWQVPINADETMADLVAKLSLPIILVVGIRVGCLNHSLLTYQAILQRQLKLAAWLGSVVDPNTPEVQAHIETLQKNITAPFLGLLPYNDFATNYVNLMPLLTNNI